MEKLLISPDQLSKLIATGIVPQSRATIPDSNSELSRQVCSPTIGTSIYSRTFVMPEDFDYATVVDRFIARNSERICPLSEIDAFTDKNFPNQHCPFRANKEYAVSYLPTFPGEIGTKKFGEIEIPQELFIPYGEAVRYISDIKKPKIFFAGFQALCMLDELSQILSKDESPRDFLPVGVPIVALNEEKNLPHISLNAELYAYAVDQLNEKNKKHAAKVPPIFVRVPTFMKKPSYLGQENEESEERGELSPELKEHFKVLKQYKEEMMKDTMLGLQYFQGALAHSWVMVFREL